MSAEAEPIDRIRGRLTRGEPAARPADSIGGEALVADLAQRTFGSFVRVVGGGRRRFYDYRARGVPFGPDDGTLAPWAVAASLPFAPEIVLSDLRHFTDTYPTTTGKYGYKCSLNPTFPVSDPEGSTCISTAHYAIDQGPVVLMIENYRSGRIWRLMRRCPYAVIGLRRSGFRGGWLDGVAGRIETSQRR